MATYITLPSLSANHVLTASYMNTLHDDLQVFSKHNHSGSAGEGITIVGACSGASPFVRRIEINPVISPSSTNWSQINVGVAAIMNQFITTANDNTGPSVVYPLNMFPGTYNILIMHQNNPGNGIFSASLYGTYAGSIDTYNAANSYDNVIILSGIGIASPAASGLLKLSACGKNASSTGFTRGIQLIKVYRTGD